MQLTLKNIMEKEMGLAALGGRTNPLSESTIRDIKDCFGLISARERELAEALDFDQAKP